MNTLKASLRSIVLGLGVLGLLAANIVVGYYAEAGGGGPAVNNGTFYSVPAGASYDWAVSGDSSGHALILADGGGLNVVQYAGQGQFYGDVGTTAYADNISYQLSGYDGGWTYLYVGW